MSEDYYMRLVFILTIIEESLTLNELHLDLWSYPKVLLEARYKLLAFHFLLVFTEIHNFLLT